MITWIRGTGILLLLCGAAVVAPSYAAAQPPLPAAGAVLYELTENLNFKAFNGGQRKATSHLLGVALAGTPLCPTALALAAGADSCTINATGSDNISLTTGLGNFGGTFTVVANCIAGQCDNPVDSPEIVIGRGHFSGKMDFSPAITKRIPLGTVIGEVGLNGSRPVPFKGTFRLPVGTTANAYYLGATRWEPVLPNEQALGYPTVRFEVSFTDVSE
jgi:hypothetical protein